MACFQLRRTRTRRRCQAVRVASFRHQGPGHPHPIEHNQWKESDPGSGSPQRRGAQVEQMNTAPVPYSSGGQAGLVHTGPRCLRALQTNATVPNTFSRMGAQTAGPAVIHRPDGQLPGRERPSSQPLRLGVADPLSVCPAGIPGPSGPPMDPPRLREGHVARRPTHRQPISFPLAVVPECASQPGLRTHSCQPAGCLNGRSSAHTRSGLGTSEGPDGGNETGSTRGVIPCLARIRARTAKAGR